MTTATIPRYASDASPDEISAALLEHGVVIVERLADDDLCDRMLAEVQPWSAASPTGGDEFSGVNTRRTGRFVDALSVECGDGGPSLDPRCRRSARCGRRRRPSNFISHSRSRSVPTRRRRCCTAINGAYDFFPFPQDVVVEVSCIWAISRLHRRQWRDARRAR
jgi:hypothetical protein